MQHAAKFAGGEQGHILLRRQEGDAAIERLDGEQSGRAPSEIGQVDLFGDDREVRAVDRLQISEIIDQRHQVPPGRSDILGIARIIGAKRSIALRTDGIGIGDDPPQRLAQRPVEPFAEFAGIERDGRVLYLRRCDRALQR